MSQLFLKTIVKKRLIPVQGTIFRTLVVDHTLIRTTVIAWPVILRSQYVRSNLNTNSNVSFSESKNGKRRSDESQKCAQ